MVCVYSGGGKAGLVHFTRFPVQTSHYNCGNCTATFRLLRMVRHIGQ